MQDRKQAEVFARNQFDKLGNRKYGRTEIVHLLNFIYGEAKDKGLFGRMRVKDVSAYLYKQAIEKIHSIPALKSRYHTGQEVNWDRPGGYKKTTYFIDKIFDDECEGFVLLRSRRGDDTMMVSIFDIKPLDY